MNVHTTLSRKKKRAGERGRERERDRQTDLPTPKMCLYCSLYCSVFISNGYFPVTENKKNVWHFETYIKNN